MRTNPLTLHLDEIGETYWQHQRRALWFALHLLCAGAAALVHAFLPFLFVHTGSRTIGRLHEAMITRRRVPAGSPASSVTEFVSELPF